MADPSAVGGNAVEDGKTTTDWKAFLVGIATPLVLPLVNGLLAKIGATPLTSEQVNADILYVMALCTAWIGARTGRKMYADKSAAEIAAAGNKV